MPSNTGFPNATYRHDPYRSFRFRLKWDGRYVAGVSKVSALTRATRVITHRGGGDPTPSRKIPGQSEYAPITLQRGVTLDPAFSQWANQMWDHPAGDSSNQVVSLSDVRRDIVLEMYNEAGQKVLAYTIFRAWPSEFIAMPELDASGDAVAIMSLTLQTEGWERDTSVAEPVEPNFTLPGG
ncbi:MAG: phage tail protein [Pseudomonadota bacterium]